MANSTHKLLIANVEEALPRKDMLFSYYYDEKSAGMFARFLAELHPGDMLVVPWPLDKDFCAYMNSLIGLGNGTEYVVDTGITESRLLADAVLANEKTVSLLREKCQSQDWHIEAFIETPAILKLAEALGIPTQGTDPKLINDGLIEDLNDKLYFKRMAEAAGIPTVLGHAAHDDIELNAELRNWGKRFHRVMLRKTKYAGGAGNLSGPARILQAKIRDWYNSGTVMIEPFLNITEVSGSLVRISDDVLEFIGRDRQIFEHGGWCGFTAPFRTPGAEKLYEDFNVEAIREGALKLAEIAQKRGARGLMNLDWAFVSGQHDTPVVLECNFRRNGFGYVVEFAKSYFGAGWNKHTLYCRESIPCGFPNFERLCLRLQEVTWRGEKVFIDRPGAERGLIITNPPREGKISVAIFGPDQHYISEVWRTVSPIIENNL
ncbi:hypothetical protein IJT17_08740 [bacterium]|nr:hypothetical protein [bacterium]